MGLKMTQIIIEAFVSRLALLKIICSLLNHRIKSECQSRKIINKNQIGFKENHRTSDNLLVFKNVEKRNDMRVF